MMNSSGGFSMLLMLVSNPFLWALVSLFGLLGLTAAVSSRKMRSNSWFSVSMVILYAVGQVVMVLPVCVQPRFDFGLAQKILGIVIVLASLVLGAFPGFSMKRFQLSKSRFNFDSQGIFTIVKSPTYMADILLSLGLALVFGSIYGLLLIPVWWAGLRFHLAIEERSVDRALGKPYLAYQAENLRIPFPGRSEGSQNEKPYYPFKNLVFKGGGVKGFAYIGAIKVLDEYQLLEPIERVAGSSAGAITSMLLSLRLSSQETIEVINTFNIDLLKGNQQEEKKPGIPARIGREASRVTSEIEGLRRMLRNYGWNSSAYFYSWLQDFIAPHCGGNGRATFADFRKRGFRDLYVVASNLSRNTTEVFCYDRTPQVAVADAVRMSVSIPLYFEALQFDGNEFGQGDYYVDGGTLDNYPLHIFDAAKYSHQNDWYIGHVNWESLGFYLTPNACDQEQSQDFKDLREFITSFAEHTVRAQQHFVYKQNRFDRYRTVEIDSCGIGSTQFEISPGSELYLALVNTAESATRRYLENYKIPGDLELD
jgi:NTE family protein